MDACGSTFSYRSYSQRWALLAGISVYSDPDIPRLSVCTRDADALYRMLVANGFGTQSMRLRVAPGRAEQMATRAEILATLTILAQLADVDDLLLFYFSGHGIAHDGQAYLLPTDARYVALTDTGIDLGRVKKVMQQSAARARVLIIDACHSGARLGKTSLAMSREFVRHVFQEAEGIAVIASCKQEQLSWEWPEKQQSVFTHYLLEGLKGAADYEDKGFVTIVDIHRYVTDNVRAWAAEHNRVQTPTLQCEMAGDPVLVEFLPFAHSAHWMGKQSETLDAVLRHLCNGQSVALVNRTGRGDGRLLAELSGHVRRRGAEGGDAASLVVSYVDLHGIGHDYSPGAFWRQGLAPLDDTGRKAEQLVQPEQANRVLEELSQHLGRQGKRLVLLLDGVDGLVAHPAFRNFAFFSILSRAFDSWPNMSLAIATSRELSELNQEGQGLPGAGPGSPLFEYLIEMFV